MSICVERCEIEAVLGRVSWHDGVGGSVAAFAEDLDLLLEKAVLEASQNCNAAVVVVAEAEGDIVDLVAVDGTGNLNYYNKQS
jgi:hypothetical protein